MVGKCTYHCCDLCGERDRLHEVIAPAWFGTMYLCDNCFEEKTGMVAVCADHCVLPLDHTGPCQDFL